MPRRKRRKSCSRKDPLIFTESPVSRQRNAPTPVFCARHPTTAQSVPVEECSSFTWVSPQFTSAQASTQGGLRRSRRRRRNTLSNLTKQKPCTCHGGVSVSSAGKISNKRSKFKPLLFIGDATPGQTVIQDIDITDDDNDDDCDDQNSDRKKDQSARNFKENVNDKVLRTPASNASESVCFDRDLSMVSVTTPDPNSYHGDNAQSPLQEIPVKRLFSDLTNNPTVDVTSPQFKSKHRKDKYRSRLLENLDVTLSGCVSPSTGRLAASHVIVPDTPEAEYGMCNRLRRIRKSKIS